MFKAIPKTRARNGSKIELGRTSQGAGQAPQSISGLGVYIARRGLDFGTSVALQSLDGIARLAMTQPLELLSLLPDIVPEVGLATWNGLRLGCGSGAVRIKGMTAKADGGSEEDPKATAAIDNLFNNLPDEVGSFTDLLSRNYLSVLYSGMCATEAVPGPRNTGLKEVWPVNALTLRFKREDDGTLALYQRQTFSTGGIGSLSSSLGFSGDYVSMPMDRFFWASLDGFPDDPYGRAPFAPALTEVLRILSFVNDMQTAFHRVGMPKYDVGYDFEGAAIYARDIVFNGMGKPEQISAWVDDDFEQAQSAFRTLEVDDAFWHGIKSTVGVVGSGKEMPDVSKIFDILRYRLTVALKQNPVLMGFVNGSTETWSDVQWEIYGKGGQAMVEKAAQPLIRAASLHLRLLGIPAVAEAEFSPIRSIQRLEDAQAEQVEIANEVAKVSNLWQLNTTAAMTITGSDIPSQEERETDVKPAPTPTIVPPAITPMPKTAKSK